jgi:hypothetical protein
VFAAFQLSVGCHTQQSARTTACTQWNPCAAAAAAAACSEFAKAVGITFKTPTEVFG